MPLNYRMHKHIILLFLVSLFLFSCKGGKTSDQIIDKDRMTQLLTEVHLVDGRMYAVFSSQDSINKYGTSRFDALFKRYHTDSVQFKKSLKYYTTQPVEFQKMYDQIMTNLKKQSDSLLKLQHREDSLIRIKQQQDKPKIQ